MRTNIQAVSRARARFLTEGDLQQGSVAGVIERSWRRCVANGVEVSHPADEMVYAGRELLNRREKHHLLLQYAQEEMATLSAQIAHTGSLVILTDDEGVVLHCVGDHAYADHLKKMALYPGASWNEVHRGTNAIGTALVEKSAVSVHGAEHFMERHHVLGCSAVPIFGADNRLMGVLDVTSDSARPEHHTLALVRMSAQMIENQHFLSSFGNGIALHFHARPELIGTLWEGIAMFSSDGELLAVNRSGQFQLGLGSGDAGGHFDGLFDIPMGVAFASGEGMVMPLHLANGARVYARVDAHRAAQAAHTGAARATRKEKPAAAPDLSLLETGDAAIALAIGQIRKVLDQDIPILIEGETGVGKELFARAIHEAGFRRNGPWVAVNCAALPEGLIESELFGYEEGAFTGARRKGSLGKLEQAHGGTLFLDEIGDMPMMLQARLLRVLQERSVTPLGATRARPLDFSLVSATNQKLRERVATGEFRRDLYYRLNGLGISLPPLRQRTDIAVLVRRLLDAGGASGVSIAPEIMQIFQRHPWPGNVRQLHNVIKTALALSGQASIEMQHLPRDFLDEMTEAAPAMPISGSLDGLAAEAVRAALRSHGGNVSAAARQLGISRNTLYRKLRESGLH